MVVRATDLARTLLARERERRTHFATRAENLRALLAAEVTAAHREGLLRRAWLIGSLAGGRFGEASDVDVVVEGLAPEAVGALWARLDERLETAVDLLRFESLPARFRSRVLREGIPITDPPAE